MRCDRCGAEFVFGTFVNPKYQAIIPMCDCVITRKMISYSVDHGLLYIKISKRRTKMKAFEELSPLGKLLQSRKFLLLVLDTIVSVLMFFTAAYFPASEESVKFLIGALQPVFVAIIVAISIEDAAIAKAQ